MNDSQQNKTAREIDTLHSTLKPSELSTVSSTLCHQSILYVFST